MMDVIPQVASKGGATSFMAGIGSHSSINSSSSSGSRSEVTPLAKEGRQSSNATAHGVSTSGADGADSNGDEDEVGELRTPALLTAEGAATLAVEGVRHHQTSQSSVSSYSSMTSASAALPVPIPVPVPMAYSSISTSATATTSYNKQYTTQIVKSLFGPFVGPVMADYSCTKSRQTGRLYVGTYATCYYSNLFGMERKMILRYGNVYKVEQYKSLGISIVIRKSKHHNGSKNKNISNSNSNNNDTSSSSSSKRDEEYHFRSLGDEKKRQHVIDLIQGLVRKYQQENAELGAGAMGEEMLLSCPNSTPTTTSTTIVPLKLDASDDTTTTNNNDTNANEGNSYNETGSNNYLSDGNINERKKYTTRRSIHRRSSSWDNNDTNSNHSLLQNKQRSLSCSTRHYHKRHPDDNDDEEGEEEEEEREGDLSGSFSTNKSSSSWLKASFSSTSSYNNSSADKNDLQLQQQQKMKMNKVKKHYKKKNMKKNKTPNKVMTLTEPKTIIIEKANEEQSNMGRNDDSSTPENESMTNTTYCSTSSDTSLPLGPTGSGTKHDIGTLVSPSYGEGHGDGSSLPSLMNEEGGVGGVHEVHKDTQNNDENQEDTDDDGTDRRSTPSRRGKHHKQETNGWKSDSEANYSLPSTSNNVYKSGLDSSNTGAATGGGGGGTNVSSSFTALFFSSFGLTDLVDTYRSTLSPGQSVNNNSDGTKNVTDDSLIIPPTSTAQDWPIKNKERITINHEIIEIQAAGDDSNDCDAGGALTDGSEGGNDCNVVSTLNNPAIKASWETVIASTVTTYKELALEKRTLPATTYNDLDRFFHQFMANDASHSVKSYKSDVIGDTEINITPWVKVEHNSDTSSNCIVPSYRRSITFRHKVVAPVGPPSTKATKYQTYTRYGQYGIILDTKTVLDDVPNADCFYVEDRVVIEKGGNGRDCGTDAPLCISARFQVRHVKSCMWKRIIDKMTKAEVMEWFSGYADMIADAIGNYSGDSGKVNSIGGVGSGVEKQRGEERLDESLPVKIPKTQPTLPPSLTTEGVKGTSSTLTLRETNSYNVSVKAGTACILAFGLALILIYQLVAISRNLHMLQLTMLELKVGNSEEILSLRDTIDLLREEIADFKNI